MARIRSRLAEDIEALVPIAQAVQEADGYPGRAPRDFARFLDAPDGLASWVAERNGRVVGHVSLHQESLPVVMQRAAAFLERDAAELAVVARLFVDPTLRRAGIGRALLAVAATEARERGLHPILDVVTEYRDAIALYESCKWRNAGEVVMTFSDGVSLRSYVFVAPDADEPR